MSESKPTSSKILVIDDQPENLEFLMALLTEHGYQVQSFSEGQAALGAIRTSPPDLILPDIDMPAMNGYEVCRPLQADEQSRSIPVIFISGMAEIQNKKDAFAAGGVDFLTKPFETEEVLIRVETHLALSSARKQLEAKNVQLEQEITKRTRAEAVAQEQVKKVRRLIENAGESIFSVDKDGVFLMMNTLAAKSLGGQPDDFIGKTIGDLFPPDIADSLMADIRQVIESKASLDSENMSVLQGEPRWYRTHIEPLINPAGLCSSVQAISHDITNLKQTEAALRESESKYRRLFENAAIGIFYSTVEGRFIAVNLALARMLGYDSPQDVVNSIHNISEQVYVDPSQRSKILADMLAKDEAVKVENRYRRKDGSIWIGELILRHVMGADGKVQYLEGFVEDITERKQAEETLKESEKKYRTLFEGAKDAIFLADGETGIILDVNTQAETLLGRSKEEIVGMHQSELHPDFQKKQTRTSFNDDVERQEETIFKEFQVVHKDGHTIPVEISPSIIQIEGRQCVYGIFRDITERKKAEEALKKSEAFLNATGQMAKVGGWELNREPQELTWTEETYRIHELPLENKPSLQEGINFYHPQDRGKIAEAVQKALSFGDPFDMECRLITAKGKLLWVRAICKPVFIGDKVVKLTGTFQDITEQKQAEQALIASEKQFRTLVNTSPFPIAIADTADEKILYWSKSAQDLVGHTPKTVAEWYALAYPDPHYHQDVIARWKPYLEQAHHSKTAVNTGEYQIVCRDGSVKICELYAQFIPDRLIVTINDITERKKAEERLRQSEEKYRTLFESVTNAIFMFDPDTFEILEANEATSKLYGYNHAELIGMSCLKFSAEVDKSKTVSQQVRKKGQENAPLRHHKKKDGSDIYVKLTGYKISVSGRDVMFAVCTDITERKQAEAALQEYSERLEDMVEARTRKLREAQEQLIRREKLATMGQLSGSVAHELRRPLGVINQALYLLQTLHANGEAETIEYLDIIAGQVHKSAKIISDLLNFSRTGLAERAEREEIIVSSLVQRVLAAQPAPEPVDVRVEIAATLPPVFVDNQHIEQVLTNLVSNAYQAMPNGGRLTISAQPDADKVVLAVADTGAGISPENIDKLFEPLFTTKTKGVGLGLAVSKNLVEANGGSIKVESEVGEGSIFTIRLPLA